LGLSETARFVFRCRALVKNNRHAQKKIHRRWFRACRHANARREPRKRQSGKPGNDRSFASRVPSIPDWWGASRAPPRCGPPPRRGRTARLVCPAAKIWGGGQSGVRLFAFAVGFLRAFGFGGGRGGRSPQTRRTDWPFLQTPMVGKARFRWTRAPGNRRVHRPRPARSRTCTLDALHVRRTSPLDARSERYRGRLDLRARRSRAVRRA
jgi:hypothetical protein